MDRPTHSISSAVLITTNKAAAVKISWISLRATILSRRGTTRRPTMMTAAIMPMPLAMPIQLVPVEASKLSANSGIRASSGITARSWNSRMAKVDWPCGVASC